MCRVATGRRTSPLPLLFYSLPRAPAMLPPAPYCSAHCPCFSAPCPYYSTQYPCYSTPYPCYILLPAPPTLPSVPAILHNTLATLLPASTLPYAPSTLYPAPANLPLPLHLSLCSLSLPPPCSLYQLPLDHDTCDSLVNKVEILFKSYMVTIFVYTKHVNINIFV